MGGDAAERSKRLDLPWTVKACIEHRPRVCSPPIDAVKLYLLAAFGLGFSDRFQAIRERNAISLPRPRIPR